MHPNTDRRKRPRRKPFSTQKDLTITIGAGPGTRSGPGRFARLIDCSASGLRLELETPLDEHRQVHVVGVVDTPIGQQKLNGPCRVRWCAPVGPATFVAGLAYVTREDQESDGQNPGEKDESNNCADHYELLQVSRTADMETIRRVFHILAARYHPDNQETGNAELFRQIVDAYEILSDTERRAGYDSRLANRDQGRYKLFKTWEESQGVEAEVRKRQGILRLLYGKRLSDPHLPTLTVRDFEELLGVPREHLEFSFWLLKESKLLLRSDNNRFEITVQGVLTYETEERMQKTANTRRNAVDLLPEPVGARQ